MSAIDTVDHVHLGFFFDLPIYWPINNARLESITDDPAHKDIRLNGSHITIGGGSGEHPALIIDLEAAVFTLMREANCPDVVPDMTASTGELNDWKIAQLVHEISDDDRYFWYSLNTNQWPLETFISIHGKMGTHRVDLQTRIILAMALLTIHELPYKYIIKNPKILEFIEIYRAGEWGDAYEYLDTHTWFHGVHGLLGCNKMGKIIKNNEAQWGYSLEDWKRDNVGSY